MSEIPLPSSANQGPSSKRPVLKLGNYKRPLVKTEWAEELDMKAPCEMVENPAMTFQFSLDNFQLQAISALEEGYNVFVAAHTSAGKTVVAEYAIAMSQRNGSRAIYTSPVKALSNQKYNDFRHTFENVGLITGDIQINESADCLIMTTEILRSMLYNSSDKIRNLQFVVFDEVHYINDPERGHVWEEVLILLPKEVQIVMLSATVPNVIEFANWVGRTQQRKVKVCTTEHRPVPLQHFLYIGGGGRKEKRYLVKTADGPFDRNKYFELAALKKDEEIKEKKAKRRQLDKIRDSEMGNRRRLAQIRGEPPGSIKRPEYSELISAYKEHREKAYWRELIAYLGKNDWMPTVVFAFSRKTCDLLAELVSYVELTTKTDKMHINSFFKRQVDKLDEIDRSLPQIVKMGTYLQNGIGVHHSGILPILKEMVEVLFQQGKVKMLFATETFAMGVNMPARTVVFQSIKKFDGNQLRILLPSEYIQMAGRAGRRGKDSAGNVVIITPPESLQKLEDLEKMMLGTPCNLQSQFKLKYRMILNALSSPGLITVQNIMARSYCENRSQLKHSQYRTDLVALQQDEDQASKAIKEKLNETETEHIAEFFDKAYDYYLQVYEKHREVLAPSRIQNQIHPGRLVKVSQGPHINRVGVVINISPSPLKYKVMVLKTSYQELDNFRPKNNVLQKEDLDMWYRMISWAPQFVNGVSGKLFDDQTKCLEISVLDIVEVWKTTILLQDLNMDNVNRDMQKDWQPGGWKCTDDTFTLRSRLLAALSKPHTVIEENNVSSNHKDGAAITNDLLGLKEELDITRAKIASIGKQEFLEKFEMVFVWKVKKLHLKRLSYNLSEESMSLYPDYINKLALLKERNLISPSETVLMKGLMAARVSKYELIVSEMLMENVLQELGPEEVAALLSVLVCKSKSRMMNGANEFQKPCPTVPEDKIKTEEDEELLDEDMHKSLPDTLNNAILEVKLIMDKLHQMENRYNISDFDGSEGNKLSFELVPIMYSWAKQRPFIEVARLAPDYQEGLLVRYIQQLLEALKEVETAAKVMGDPSVPEKINLAGEKIKRGIVFAPSLYTTIE